VVFKGDFVEPMDQEPPCSSRQLMADSEAAQRTGARAEESLVSKAQDDVLEGEFFEEVLKL
jgi:hypothetical protein